MDESEKFLGLPGPRATLSEDVDRAYNGRRQQERFFNQVGAFGTHLNCCGATKPEP
jgi:hypothetical protein